MRSRNIHWIALAFISVLRTASAQVPTLSFTRIIPENNFGYISSITPGPDGALWFTDHSRPGIERITTSGVLTKFSDPGIWFSLADRPSQIVLSR